MKASIFNPYMDTLGGGERYTALVAFTLKQKGWDVDIEWNDKGIIKKLEDRFGLNLEGINIVPDIKRGDGYDICFWVSDGSIPILYSRKNILHFQFPFRKVNGKSLINKMKLFRISSVIVNSAFTKSFIDMEFGVKSEVVYPPVNTKKLYSRRKDKSILYVGRFSTLTQKKGHDTLIQIFKKYYNSHFKDYKLILAGGGEVGAGEYLVKLRKMVNNFPIEIVVSPDIKILREIYARSRFFWSAAGYGVNEEIEPTKVEHFGMTVVEAMASGCIPLIYASGGHKEIVENGIDGYVWKNERELVKKTSILMEDYQLYSIMLKQAKIKAEQFSDEHFMTNFSEAIKI